MGGNGLVHPGQQVAVGSLVLMDDEDWSIGNSVLVTHMLPATTLEPTMRRTFTVDIAGVVGSDPAAMTWANNAGITGTLDLGSNYHAPLPVEVNDGVLASIPEPLSLVELQSFSSTPAIPSLIRSKVNRTQNQLL